MMLVRWFNHHLLFEAVGDILSAEVVQWHRRPQLDKGINVLGVNEHGKVVLRVEQLIERMGLQATRQHLCSRANPAVAAGLNGRFASIKSR